VRLREITPRLIVHDPTPPAGLGHAALWLAQAVASLLGREPSPTLADVPVLSFTDEEKREAEHRTRGLPPRFLAVHPGSGSPSKNWPVGRFLEAARRLAGDHPWLLVAGPAEAELAAPSGATCAREWPLRVLGAALGRAGLFLGNDAGVSHLAAAAGAPTLALFGPSDPGVWAPVGPHVAILRARAGSMAELDCEAVLAAAERLRSAASGLPSG
jgi:ADP-heptose:LPS heptosyltransferase